MCLQTKYLYLKSHPLFKGAEEITLAQIAPFLKVQTIYRGETLDYGYGGNSRIFFIVKGKIKIAESNDQGDELIKSILTEGDIFGDLGLFGNPPAEEYAVALTANTVVCCLPVKEFKKFIETNTQIAINYANDVNNKLRRLEDRHADLVFRDTKERLIRFIKNWAEMDGCKVGDKIVLANYLTHSDIAGFISTSRQSVNVLLNELRDSGIICYDRKRIELNSSIIWN